MTEEKNLAEVEAEYKKLLEKKTSAMREEFKKKEELKAAKEAEEEEKKKKADFKAAVEAEVKRIMKENKTPEGENIDSDDKQNTNSEPKELPKEIAFAKSFAESRNLTLGKYKELANSYILNGVDAFKASYSDAGCEDDVSAWEKNDCFADVIWQDVICQSDFLNKGITVKGLDFTEGCGGTIQIRVINHADPADDFGEMTPCNCMSCVSNTFTTYSLTMETYGDYKVLCDLNLFTAGREVKQAVMDSMSIVARERIDNEIYTNLEAATPTYTEDLDAACGGGRGTDGDCCTYSVNLYDAIVDLEADMRAAGYFKGVDPVLIVHPTIAAYLKYKDGLNMPSYIASQVGMDGLKLASIGNIKVIESCHANSCVTTPSEVQAILIDPSRAIGEAWGKKPTFKVDDDPIECGSQKVVLRMWASFGTLDEGAIGHILNP